MEACYWGKLFHTPCSFYCTSSGSAVPAPTTAHRLRHEAMRRYRLRHEAMRRYRDRRRWLCAVCAYARVRTMIPHITHLPVIEAGTGGNDFAKYNEALCSFLCARQDAFGRPVGAAPVLKIPSKG
eukprot:gene19022-biopygen20495